MSRGRGGGGGTSRVHTEHEPDEGLALMTLRSRSEPK